MSSGHAWRGVRAGLILAGVLALGSGCAYKGPRTSPDSGGATLVDTYWQLISVDGVEVATAAGGREAHIILRPDNRVTGFGGCNGFNGSWQEEDGKLSLGPLMSTMMACPELDLERRVLGALDGDILAEIEGETLRVTGADGTELVFAARYDR